MILCQHHQSVPFKANWLETVNDARTHIEKSQRLMEFSRLRLVDTQVKIDSSIELLVRSDRLLTTLRRAMYF